MESTVNEVISKRFVKEQQMRWTKEGAQHLLQVRVQVLNKEREKSKRTDQEANKPSAVIERLNWRGEMMGKWPRRSTQEKRARRCTILREAGLLDEFFVFVEAIGLMAVLEQLSP